MIKTMETTELLGLNKFQVDEEEAHIVLDKAACARCVKKPCLRVCPAGLYTEKNGEIMFDYAGCLECGTCRLQLTHGTRKPSVHPVTLLRRTLEKTA